MDRAYIERAAGDLQRRVSSLRVNDQLVQLSRVIQKGASVEVITIPIQGMTKLTSLQLLDDQGALITEREVNLDVVDDQILSFRFEFEVKGGAM
ncbi:hypothetical protein NSQ24_01505 [Brevibacillus sp. FSL L8-0520]|uniref:hypothetical protein n=1 Tax=Brevibacillus sp. FSL L8-0520 TaxID=2954689 RepID=UPI0030CFE99A